MIDEAKLADYLYVCSHLSERAKEGLRAYGWNQYDPEKFATWRWSTAKYGYILLGSDGLPLCLGGVSITRFVGHAWLLTTDRFDSINFRQTRALLFAVKKVIVALLDGQVVFRMEATVVNGDERNARFAEALGFEREGIMRKAGANGEDLHLYSIIGG